VRCVDEKVMDFRGEPCPGPLIKTVKTLSNLGENKELVVLTDIEECMKTIKEAVELLDVTEVTVKRENKHWRIVIKT